MYLIVARNYPPEVGGIQTVMGGLSKALSKYELIKVFTFKSKSYKKNQIFKRSSNSRFINIHFSYSIFYML